MGAPFTAYLLATHSGEGRLAWNSPATVRPVNAVRPSLRRCGCSFSNSARVKSVPHFSPKSPQRPSSQLLGLLVSARLPPPQRLPFTRSSQVFGRSSFFTLSVL